MQYIQDIKINIVDSREDNKTSFLYVKGDDFECRVPIIKAKINDLCYIMKLVGTDCHINLDTKGCEAAK
jgi:hypothetical protein